MMLRQCLLAFTTLFLIVGCNKQAGNEESRANLRRVDHIAGTEFTPIPSKTLAKPTFKSIKIPLPSHATNAVAIWGATGRDDNGNIYFGVSTEGVVSNVGNSSRTAYLFRYDPISDTAVLQGDVLSEMKRLGMYKDGLGQNKIHSKIYQANDGYLYFTSLDEEGETEETNPIWGGHLWRKKPNESHWEHLLATDEALVALNTNGRYIYALGYWDHVLYQYDIDTGHVKKSVVGSAQNHVSRNILVNKNGEVFVPQVNINTNGEIKAHLNHYNTDLSLISSYPLSGYIHKSNIKYHHGIIGYTPMRNGDIFFTTSDGNLYVLKENASQGSKLELIGNMHPERKAYTPSLFTFEGRDFIIGLTQRGNRKADWLVYHTGLKSGTSVSIDDQEIDRADFWGTLTKDNAGDFYVGGWHISNSSHQRKPIFTKISISN